MPAELFWCCPSGIIRHCKNSEEDMIVANLRIWHGSQIDWLMQCFIPSLGFAVVPSFDLPFSICTVANLNLPCVHLLQCTLIIILGVVLSGQYSHQFSILQTFSVNRYYLCKLPFCVLFSEPLWSWPNLWAWRDQERSGHVVSNIYNYALNLYFSK